MCVKIIREEGELIYNPARPLEEQIKGSQEVVVNYVPFDKSIDRFLEEMQKFAKYGVQSSLSIRVMHNNHLAGFRMKKSIEKALNDITLNEIIKVMVISHVEVDQKLQELASCFEGTRK